jgi:hypothetical protein
MLDYKKVKSMGGNTPHFSTSVLSVVMNQLRSDAFGTSAIRVAASLSEHMQKVSRRVPLLAFSCVCV